MGRFVKDGAFAASSDLQKLFFQGLVLPWQEAVEGEGGKIKPADGHGGDAGAGPGYRHHRDALLGSQPDNFGAGVRNGRGAGVRHHGYINAFLQHPVCDFIAPAFFVVLMAGNEGGINAEMIGEFLGDPGILSADEIHVFQGFNGTGAHIGQVADGGGHHIKHGSFLRFVSFGTCFPAIAKFHQPGTVVPLHDDKHCVNQSGKKGCEQKDRECSKE